MTLFFRNWKPLYKHVFDDAIVSYILTDGIKKVRRKLKAHHYIPWLSNVIKSFKKTLNWKYRAKLNIKSEKLVLPKEWVENALINLYWSKQWPHPNNT